MYEWESTCNVRCSYTVPPKNYFAEVTPLKSVQGPFRIPKTIPTSW